MSWMTSWIARFLGKRSLTAQVESIVARVEPLIWQVIDGRVPMGSPQEVHGYVWARSAAVIRTAAYECASDVSENELQQIIQQARDSVADRIVSQLQIYADERLVLQHAA